VQSPRVVIKDNHQIHIVNHEEIVFVESADDYVKIHTATRYYLKKKTMNYFEEVLSSAEFCRVHRGYIVALAQIIKLEPWEKDGAIITLKNKKEIPVSKAGYKRLKEVLGY
jgi:two-component system, LytTR family, response regulator